MSKTSESMLSRLVRRAANAVRPVRLEDPQTQSVFFRLPPELRLMVYHYALIKEDDGTSNDTVRNRVSILHLQCPALIATCRTIQREALPYYFRHEKFTYPIIADNHTNVRMLPDQIIRRWWKATAAQDLKIHDVLFIIWVPPAWCPCCGSRTDEIRRGALVYIPFIAIGRDSGIRLTFLDRPSALLYVDRMPAKKVERQNRRENQAAWKHIESLAEGGLRVMDLVDVARQVVVMSRLGDRLSWKDWFRFWRPEMRDKKILREQIFDLLAWCAVACEFRRKKLEEATASNPKKA